MSLRTFNTSNENNSFFEFYEDKNTSFKCLIEIGSMFYKFWEILHLISATVVCFYVGLLIGLSDFILFTQFQGDIIQEGNSGEHKWMWLIKLFCFVLISDVLYNLVVQHSIKLDGITIYIRESMFEFCTKFMIIDLISLVFIITVALTDKKYFVFRVVQDTYEIYHKTQEKHGHISNEESGLHYQIDNEQQIFGFDKYKVYKLFRALYFFRFLKITRYIKALRLIYQIIEEISPLWCRLIDFLKNFMRMVLVIHFFTCAWLSYSDEVLDTKYKIMQEYAQVYDNKSNQSLNTMT